MGQLRFLRELKRRGYVHPERGWLRLLAVTGGLLLVATLYGVFFYAPAMRRDAVRGWEGQLAAALEYRRVALEGWLSAYRADARTIASFPSVVEGLAAAVPAAPAHLDMVLDQVTAENEFAGIWLFDQASRRVAQYGAAESTGVTATVAGFARRFQAGGEAVEFLPDARGEPMLLIGAPVRQGSRLVGSAVVQLDPRRSIYQITSLQGSPTRTGEVHLVMQVGDSVVRLTPARAPNAAPPLAQRTPLRPDCPAGAALLNERTAGEFEDSGGLPVIVATTRIAGTPWAMFNRIDSAEALADYRDQLWHYAVVAFGVIGLVLGSLLLLGGWNRRLLEQQRQETDARLNELAANAGDIIFRFRLQPRIVCEYINPAVAGITGFAPEDIYADPLLPGRQVHPEDTRSFEEMLNSHVAAEPTSFRFYHRDGSERMLELLNFPVRNERGELVAVEGVARDVTRIHEHEVALRRSEARHRTLFENLAQGIIYREQGAPPRLNAAAEEILGVTEAEVVAGGLEVIKAYEEDGRRLTPAAFPGSVASATGVAVPHRVVRILNQREGRFRWVLMGSRPLPPAEGSEASSAVYTTLTDITAIREAEDELWGTREMYRALGESADDIILRLGPDLRILTVNPAISRYTVFRPDQAIGKSFAELGYPATVVGELEQKARGVFRDEQPRTGTGMLPGPPASYFSYRLSPEFDREGDVVSVVLWATDVTSQRALEAQYQQAQKMEAVGRLAGGVAHDFNNLITAIKGYAAFLLEDLPRNSPAHEDATEIDRAADRAARLTRQLLAFSRKQVLELRVLRLDVIVRDLESMLRRLIGEDITLVFDCKPGLWSVTADPVQVQQVLLNLVVNSRDAMERGGQLTIQLRNRVLAADTSGFEAPPAPGDYVAMTVRDSGTGMTPDTLQHIFEPFFTTKEVGRGTGLGLPTVYGIVQQSSGAIRVESAPGHGTTVEILLPRAAGAAPEPEEPQGPPVARPAGERILVVEDEPALRSLIRRMLRAAGYQVTVAESGTEALSLAAGGAAFDLLLTDVVMPGIQGGELAREFSARFPQAPVLFMSGYSDEVVAHHGVLRENATLLQKPFTQATLQQAVRAALEEARVAH